MSYCVIICIAEKSLFCYNLFGCSCHLTLGLFWPLLE